MIGSTTGNRLPVKIMALLPSNPPPRHLSGLDAETLRWLRSQPDPWFRTGLVLGLLAVVFFVAAFYVGTEIMGIAAAVLGFGSLALMAGAKLHSRAQKLRSTFDEEVHRLETEEDTVVLKLKRAKDRGDNLVTSLSEMGYLDTRVRAFLVKRAAGGLTTRAGDYFRSTGMGITGSGAP